MKDWTPRIIILGLLTAIIGLPFLLRPADATREPISAQGGNAPRIILVSPHNEQIRYEIGRAYNQWRTDHNQPAIVFDWRSLGGTSDIRKQVLSHFGRIAAAGTQDEGIGIDLFFGGGEFDHNLLAKGVEKTTNGKAGWLPVTVPIEFSDDFLKEVYPEPTIGGEKLYHPEKRWLGVVLSSFGIVYNRDVLRRINLPEPKTWTDLADPAYRGQVALADPAHSSSIAVTYDVILRRLGWTEGWQKLRRVYANARYFTASASKVPVDVSAGEAAAGMCINFYGNFQAGAIGSDRIGYVDPRYMTAVTADPISLLRGAPHKAEAVEFVQWLLSKEGQRLWQLKRGAPGGGGPERFELRRQPVRRDLYTPSEMSAWTDPVNPFEIAKPMPAGIPSFMPAVGAVSHALAIDVHDELREAWTAILVHPDHPRIKEAVALFDAMPPELTMTWPDPSLEAVWKDAMYDSNHPQNAQAVAAYKSFYDRLSGRYGNWKNADKFLEDRLRWTAQFKANYRRVVEILGGK